MSRKQLHQDIHFILLLLIAFTLPLFLNFNSFLIIVLVFNWLLLNSFKEKLQLLSQQPLNWLFMSLFLLYAIGLLYTKNFNEGINDLQQKLSLFVFPLIFSTTIPLATDKLKKIGIAFTGGVLIATVISAAFAIITYIEKGNIAAFFYHNLASGIGMNAIYLSLYCTFALILIFREIYFQEKINFKLISIAIWLLLFILLLSSKLLIFITFISINVFLIALIIKKKQKNYGIPGLVGCNLILLLFIFQIKPIQSRFSVEVVAPINVVMQQQFNYDTPFSGYTLRLTFWRFSLEILQEQKAFLFGVGTGDAQQLLDQKYKQYNIYTGDLRRGDTGYLGWNVHNQFFQLLLELGIVGLILFLAIILIPFLICLRRQQWLYLFFLTLIIFISLTESILETHKGIVYYSFFNGLFAFNLLKKDQYQP